MQVFFWTEPWTPRQAFFQICLQWFILISSFSRSTSMNWVSFDCYRILSSHTININCIVPGSNDSTTTMKFVYTNILIQCKFLQKTKYCVHNLTVTRRIYKLDRRQQNNLTITLILCPPCRRINTCLTNSIQIQIHFQGARFICTCRPPWRKIITDSYDDIWITL